jgi:(4-O-methyl)-D-glucuronate---lignin esterase
LAELLARTSGRSGRIVLADGMSYHVLVLPDNQPMPLADLEKVENLIKAGATVVGPPPTGMSGMPLHPGEEEKFNALVKRLWGGMDGTKVTQKKLGAGQLVWGQTAREVLIKEGVPPDFEVNGVSNEGTIDWIHRKVGDVEVYYVASRWAHPERVDCTFRVSGRQPQLWDPVTGEMRDATAFHQENGCTSIPLQFAPCGSIFVVFDKPISADASGKTASNYSPARPLMTLSGSWSVNFDPKWGGPKEVVFDQLMDWTNSSDPGIKYYSGTAVYHKQFNWQDRLPEGHRLLLDLGTVYDLATVRLNGHDLGVVWTKPARVDITDAVQPGKNDLAVTVVNLWPNRLIRDESLPKEQRLTETNIHKFSPTSPLLPSGLIGPVRLLSEKIRLQNQH